MIHWLAILPFRVFGFFTPPIVILYMLIYALAINMPCIIAQRYNRPRIVRIVARRG
jgi:glycosyl-4,4'-diaponeurosporenoate acyltransferase